MITEERLTLLGDHRCAEGEFTPPPVAVGESAFFWGVSQMVSLAEASAGHIDL